MWFALTKIAPTVMDSLADYPRWFVAACVTVVAVLLIWLTMKVLKWALWLLLIAVLLVGGVAVVMLLVR